MDSKTNKNQSVFIKIRKTGPVLFCRLTENRPVQFKIFKSLKIFEIKNPKKLAFILRILVKADLKVRRILP
jgi:hypothetical protein